VKKGNSEKERSAKEYMRKAKSEKGKNVRKGKSQIGKEIERK
jgi:hypothetical protein